MPLRAPRNMKLVLRFVVATVLLALFLVICVYEIREMSRVGGGKGLNDLASVYQPMKVNPADLKAKKATHTLSGDGEPEEADAERKAAALAAEDDANDDGEGDGEDEESDDTGATTQSRASRDKMAAVDAQEAADEEDEYYPEIHLASISCEDVRRADHLVTMLRSVAAFLNSDDYYITAHIICDDEHCKKINTEVLTWGSDVLKRLHVNLYATVRPANMTQRLFKKMDAKEKGFQCAFQKLFLAEILPQSVNHILYVDADTLFLTPVEDVWKEIHNDLEKVHFLAAVKEREVDEDPDKDKMKRFAYGSPVPHVGNSGVNAGVVYMRLDGLRETGFIETALEITGSYRDEIKWPDQDVLNIYCARYKDRCKLLNCSLNYRPETCTGCPDADEKGIAVLHGVDGLFDHVSPENTYRGIHQLFKKLPLPVTPELLLKLILGGVRQSTCPPKSQMFQRAEKLIWAGRLKKQGFDDELYE